MKAAADTLFVKPTLCKPPAGSLFRSPAVTRGVGVGGEESKGPGGLVFVLVSRVMPGQSVIRFFTEIHKRYTSVSV